jgi:hypothetical protein
MAGRTPEIRNTEFEKSRSIARATGPPPMSMKAQERQRLVDSWLLLQTTPQAGDEREDLAWVVEKVWDLCDDAPNDAFEFILGVLHRDVSGRTLAVLCAGPLEALLRRHGPRIITRVERRARRDAKFAELLGHVWKDALSSKIWQRVQQVRERQARYGVVEELAEAGVAS